MIRATLTHASLATLPPYTALSYCWGNGAKEKKIQLNGREFRITNELHTALLHLLESKVWFDHEGSKGKETRVLWIDAICINQEDNAEKTHQVNLMPYIYSCAAEVLVWLGSSTPETDVGMNGIATFGNVLLQAGLERIKFADLEHWQNWDDFDDHDDEELIMVKGRLKSHFERVMTSLRQGDDNELSWCRGDISRRPWFERVWVLQECFHGQEVILMCGQERVDFARFWAVAYFFQLFNGWWSFHHNVSGDEEVKERVRARLDEISTVLPTRNIGLRRIKSYRPDDERLNLKSLLCRSNVLRLDVGRLQSTKPIDRVYAILGMANDPPATSIPPDYSVSWEVAYMRTAQALLKAGHLDILGLCRKRESEDSIPLPSWVPDWRAENCQPWTLYHEDSLFNACGSSFAEVSFPEHPHHPVLSLTGVILGTISSIGSTWSIGINGDILDHLPAINNLISSIADFAAQSTRYTKEQKLEATWRVPICDLEQHGATSLPHRATLQARLGFWALYTLARNNPHWYDAHPEARIPNISYIGRLRRMFDARPFLSDTGYVGVCPMEAQPGDVVVVFRGGRVPYVLRGQGEMWKLVGEGFAYGAMDGEVMSEKSGEVQSFLLL